MLILGPNTINSLHYHEEQYNYTNHNHEKAEITNDGYIKIEKAKFMSEIKYNLKKEFNIKLKNNEYRYYYSKEEVVEYIKEFERKKATKFSDEQKDTVLRVLAEPVKVKKTKGSKIYPLLQALMNRI